MGVGVHGHALEHESSIVINHIVQIATAERSSCRRSPRCNAIACSEPSTSDKCTSDDLWKPCTDHSFPNRRLHECRPPLGSQWNTLWCSSPSASTRTHKASDDSHTPHKHPRPESGFQTRTKRLVRRAVGIAARSGTYDTKRTTTNESEAHPQLMLRRVLHPPISCLSHTGAPYILVPHCTHHTPTTDH